MKEYHKIDSLFKRTERGELILGDFSRPEFAYLARTEWEWTEKVDGTNIRVSWDGMAVRFGGKTDNAMLPVPLLDRLHVLFTSETLAAIFPL